MSTSTIISLAFLIGFIFSYRFLIDLIKKKFNKKINDIKFINEEINKFRIDVLKYYKESYNKFKKLDEETNKIINDSLNKSNIIIKQTKQQLDKILDYNTRFRLKKINDQVEKAIIKLQVNAVNIASCAVKKIIQDNNNKDEKTNDEIISSILHNLGKKLH